MEKNYRKGAKVAEGRKGRLGFCFLTANAPKGIKTLIFANEDLCGWCHYPQIFSLDWLCVPLRPLRLCGETLLLCFRGFDRVLDEGVGFYSFGFAFEGEDEAVAEGGEGY